jgi:hypothetical protein
MLAEMYFLRLESMLRTLEEAARAESPRFVPFSREAFKQEQSPVKRKSN